MVSARPAVGPLQGMTRNKVLFDPAFVVLVDASVYQSDSNYLIGSFWIHPGNFVEGRIEASIRKPCFHSSSSMPRHFAARKRQVSDNEHRKAPCIDDF